MPSIGVSRSFAIRAEGGNLVGKYTYFKIDPRLVDKIGKSKELELKYKRPTSK